MVIDLQCERECVLVLKPPFSFDKLVHAIIRSTYFFYAV